MPEGDAILVVDAEGCLALATPRAAALLALPTARLAGKPLVEALGAGHPLAALLRGETPASVTIAPPAAAQPLRAQRYPLPSNCGILITLSASRPEPEAQAPVDEERGAVLTRLLPGLAHDFRNPLNAMAVHVELLRRRSLLDAPAQQHLSVLDREIQRLDRQVRDLEDLLRPAPQPR